MARRRRKKALYEVMSKTRLKPPSDKKLEPLHPKKPAKAEPSTAKPDIAMREKTVRWGRKPKTVQLNAGRIEISLPYQLAIAVLLGLVLLMLIAFRVGFWLGHTEQRGAGTAGRTENRSEGTPVGRADVGTTARPELGERVPRPERRPEPAKPEGNNKIVIQEYRLRAHLEPVKRYFDEAGIRTEIRKVRDTYFLVTADKYNDPQRRGTDGYLAKQKIIELGPKYKAPPGYETFAPNFFTDAYGMRFDD
jgi:hypothetical protein